MAYQFAHISFFSRKGNNKGQSTSFVFGEARRDPQHSTHVESPKPPETVYGLGIDDLEALHDKQASEATMTNNKGQTRKIRQDQQTLACIVLSFPKEKPGQDNEQYHKEYQNWRSLSVDWLKEKYGNNLKSVIQHTDERHPHIHCYLMADNMKASQFNEGKQAKDAFMSSQEAKEMDKKEANKKGDKEYRQAMRAWQDDYYEKVGIPCGLARIGPQKRRLTRDQWHNEQKQAESLKKVLSQKNGFVRKTKEKAKQEADQLIQEAQERAKKILADADQKLSEIKIQISKEEEKLTSIKSNWFVKRLYENIREDGFKAGIKKSASQISKLKKTISNLKAEKKNLDKLRREDLLQSDKSNQENYTLKEQIRELTETNKEISKERDLFKEKYADADNSLNRDSIYKSKLSK